MARRHTKPSKPPSASALPEGRRFKSSPRIEPPTRTSGSLTASEQSRIPNPADSSSHSSPLPHCSCAPPGSCSAPRRSSGTPRRRPRSCRSRRPRIRPGRRACRTPRRFRTPRRRERQEGARRLVTIGCVESWAEGTTPAAPPPPFDTRASPALRPPHGARRPEWHRTDALPRGLYRGRSRAFGGTEGCFNAGLAHQLGIGVPSKPAVARQWFEVGCKIGDAESCHFAKNPPRAVNSGWVPSYP